MASASFRDQMNALGWSRRGQDEPVNTQQTGLLSSIQSLNPFGDRGYVRLPTTEGRGAPLPAPSRREEEEGWLACESLIVTPTSSYLKRVSVALAESQPTTATWSEQRWQRTLHESGSMPHINMRFWTR
ncbi:hypothetical protein VMCG_01082 [Cytospora schulzeri]|uniref:Uncharacterized protein n=1 Tax=Cytospora schulzeri TaxID=448051 RepID=A0A423X6I3_9PEZI|nr:hypothetical protein VMCG_01082 [Valsa malicola]